MESWTLFPVSGLLSSFNIIKVWRRQKFKHREYQADTGSMMEPKKQETSIYVDTGSIMEPKKQET